MEAVLVTLVLESAELLSLWCFVFCSLAALCCCCVLDACFWAWMHWNAGGVMTRIWYSSYHESRLCSQQQTLLLLLSLFFYKKKLWNSLQSWRKKILWCILYLALPIAHKLWGPDFRLSLSMLSSTVQQPRGNELHEVMGYSRLGIKMDGVGQPETVVQGTPWQSGRQGTLKVIKN
jgi:hypothetical protein